MTIAVLPLTLLLPFLFAGLINRTKAFLAGRRGAPVLQPLFDCLRLLRKRPAVSAVTTPVLQLGPVGSLAAAFAAACVAPLPGGVSLVSFPGDFILFAAVLGLGRFLLVAAALDTGSSFEGMGASREATYGVFAEPALFLTCAALSLSSGRLVFRGIVEHGAGTTALSFAVIAASVFLLLLLVEGSRVPVDDPNTHLELTMVHEVMILDHSGPDLAFASYAAWLRMVLFAGIAANLLLPVAGTAAAIALHAAAILAVAVFVGVVESSVARFRLTHVPQFILLASALALILVAALFLTRFGGIVT